MTIWAPWQPFLSSFVVFFFLLKFGVAFVSQSHLLRLCREKQVEIEENLKCVRTCEQFRCLLFFTQSFYCLLYYTLNNPSACFLKVPADGAKLCVCLCLKKKKRRRRQKWMLLSECMCVCVCVDVSKCASLCESVLERWRVPLSLTFTSGATITSRVEEQDSKGFFFFFLR